MKSALRATAKTIAGVKVARHMIGTPARVSCTAPVAAHSTERTNIEESLAFP
jgi:hypothetical protein